MITPKGCFWVEEKQMFYMIRCPKCNMENYLPDVATGICTWCEYDVNKDEYHKGEKNDKI